MAFDKTIIFKRIAPNRTAISDTPQTFGTMYIPKGQKWQRRYWEHTITTELDYSKHIDYVHFNPVKHGYVSQVQDWPYSTFYHFVKDGILPIGWTNILEVEDNNFGELNEGYLCDIKSTKM